MGLLRVGDVKNPEDGLIVKNFNVSRLLSRRNNPTGICTAFSCSLPQFPDLTTLSSILILTGALTMNSLRTEEQYDIQDDHRKHEHFSGIRTQTWHRRFYSFSDLNWNY